MNTAAHIYPTPQRTASFDGNDGGYVISMHPNHARLRHITLDAKRLRSFFDAVAQTEMQNLQYVPFMRFALAKALVNEFGALFVSDMRAILTERDSGGFTIGIQKMTTTEADYVKFATAVGYLVGPANFDAMSGTYYARFTVSDEDSSDSYLRQAYRLFTLHTDGTFVEDATDWLLMMKLSERNAVGGESRLLHLDDWAELHRFSQDELATFPFTYTSPPSKNVSLTTQRPTFFWEQGRPCICFIDQFVQPQTLEQAQYLQALSQSMESSSGTAAIALPVGDLIVLNNRFWLHGRAPFAKHADLHRELLRIRGSFARS